MCQQVAPANAGGTPQCSSDASGPAWLRSTLARNMEVGLNANMCDWTTKRIADVLHAPFKAISKDLSKDYGGSMEHLWIDLELIEAQAQHRPPYPFRFQKKVGGALDRLTGLPRPVRNNVGHYSVRPDFHELRSVPQDSVVAYVLSLIYTSTSVLVDKQKKLGGFEAQRFRSDFLSTCRQHGYEIDSTNGKR